MIALKLNRMKFQKESINKSWTMKKRLIQKRKNPVASAVASPSIASFFTLQKKKKKNEDGNDSNTSISSVAISMPVPLYHARCSGIFSIQEVMGTNARFSREKKDLSQTRLKIRQKYFLPSRFHHVNVAPGTDGILNLLTLVRVSIALRVLLLC